MPFGLIDVNVAAPQIKMRPCANTRATMMGYISATYILESLLQDYKDKGLCR